MIRTKQNLLSMQTLKGVEQDGDAWGKRINEVHGMYDREAMSLQRIPGKLLTSNSTQESVWNITQLRFRDGTALVHRHGSNIAGEILDPLPELDLLPPLIFPNIVPDDYPDTNDDAQDIGDDVVNPPPIRYPDDHDDDSGESPAILLDISEGDINCPSKWETTVQITKYWNTKCSIGGFCRARVDISQPWVSVAVGGMTHIRDSVCLGFWQDAGDHPIPMRIVADPEQAPVGTTDVTVTLTAVDIFGHTLYVDGVPITAVFTAHVTRWAFTVDAPAYIERGVPFDITITCNDPTYVPRQFGYDLHLLFTSTDHLDLMDTGWLNEYFIPYTGWVNGVKTITDIQVVYGDGDETFSFTATDAYCEISGTDSGDINDGGLYFDVEYGPGVLRGTAFDLVITCKFVSDDSVNTSYSRNVRLYLTNRTDPNDDITPSVDKQILAASWVDGVATLSKTIDGGSGNGTFKLWASDDVGTFGSADGSIALPSGYTTLTYGTGYIKYYSNQNSRAEPAYSYSDLSNLYPNPTLSDMQNVAWSSSDSARRYTRAYYGWSSYTGGHTQTCSLGASIARWTCGALAGESLVAVKLSIDLIQVFRSTKVRFISTVSGNPPTSDWSTLTSLPYVTLGDTLSEQELALSSPIVLSDFLWAFIHNDDYTPPGKGDYPDYNYIDVRIGTVLKAGI